VLFIFSILPCHCVVPSPWWTTFSVDTAALSFISTAVCVIFAFFAQRIDFNVLARAVFIVFDISEIV